MTELTGTQLYLNKWAELDGQFSAFEKIYKAVTDYLLPAYGVYSDRGKPYEPSNISNRFDNILNDAGSRANQILGAGMQGGLCSPSRKWFRLGLDDDELAEYGPVKEWLSYVEKVLYRVFNISNFYPEVHSIFEAQGGFGTGCMIEEEDLEHVVRFRMFQPGEYRLSMGKNGDVDTLYRKSWMTARQIVEMFGEANVSNAVKSASEKNKTPYEYYEVLHCIEPNKKRDPDKIDNRNMAYSSVWMEVNGESNKFLRKSGYAEKPFVAPRWRDVGSLPYGFGPGCYVVGNTKMLQEMEKGGIKALHKEIEPPLSIPSKFKDVLNLLPGGENYVDDGAKIEPLYAVKIDFEKLEFKIQQIEHRIERSFFVDLFLMIINNRENVTATEILERKEEKLILLGPTIERQIKDLFDPIITRTYNICWDRGLIPPPPEEIIDRQWQIEYISVLAKAQKRDDGLSLQAYLAEVERVAGLDPASLAKTDFDEYLEQYADIVGVPPKVVRSQDEVDEIRVAMIEQQKQRQQIEQIAAASQAAKNLGSASTEKGTVLGEMAKK
jgi:hypothetical protein